MSTHSITGHNSTSPLLSNPEELPNCEQQLAKLDDHSVTPTRDLELPKIKQRATAAATEFDSIENESLHSENSSIGSWVSDGLDENPSITFSREERKSLEAGNVVTTETVTVTPGFFGNTSESTFTAYKLLDEFPEDHPVSYRNDGASIAKLFFSPSFHQNLFNRGATIVAREHIAPATEETIEIKYTLKMQIPNTVPIVGGSELNDEMHMRSEKNPLTEGGYIISHILAKSSTYLDKLQFTITITPFKEKILISFKILFQIKGFLGVTLHRLITNKELKELPDKMLPAFIQFLGEEYTASEIEPEFSTSS